MCVLTLHVPAFCALIYKQVWKETIHVLLTSIMCILPVLFTTYCSVPQIISQSLLWEAPAKREKGGEACQTGELIVTVSYRHTGLTAHVQYLRTILFRLSLFSLLFRTIWSHCMIAMRSGLVMRNITVGMAMYLFWYVHCMPAWPFANAFIRSYC